VIDTWCAKAVTVPDKLARIETRVCEHTARFTHHGQVDGNRYRTLSD
jgi:hypothetical protein